MTGERFVRIGRPPNETPTYSSVHTRFRRERGPAKEWGCAFCAAPADHWAYQGGCPDEQRDPVSGLAFSTDADRYLPLCRRCHADLDDWPDAQNRRKTHCPRGHEYTPENTRQRGGKHGRECRACLYLLDKKRRLERTC